MVGFAFIMRLSFGTPVMIFKKNFIVDKLSVPAAPSCDIHFSLPTWSVVHLFLWKSFVLYSMNCRSCFWQWSSAFVCKSSLCRFNKRVVIVDVQTLPWVSSSCHCWSPAGKKMVPKRMGYLWETSEHQGDLLEPEQYSCKLVIKLGHIEFWL